MSTTIRFGPDIDAEQRWAVLDLIRQERNAGAPDDVTALRAITSRREEFMATLAACERAFGDDCGCGHRSLVGAGEVSAMNGLGDHRTIDGREHRAPRSIGAMARRLPK